MRLVQFQCRQGDGTTGPTTRVGVELCPGGDVVDLHGADASLPTSMRDFLEGGVELLARAEQIVSSGQCVLERRDVSILAPITRPEKIVLVCNNTYEHVEEQGLKPKIDPCLLNKFPSCIVGPGDDVIHPGEGVTACLDWEVELAMVVGKTAESVKEADALSHVAGFTILNDVTARDLQLQRNGGQMSMGKALDTFCPIGPAIVTTDQLIDPFNLDVQLTVNGDVMQSGNTSNYIFQASRVISFISIMVTLRPGDVVSLGTFAGIGHEMSPPQYLKPGDVMECKIQGIGALSNRVVER